MKNEGEEYKSIEEVRLTFYPGSAAMLGLEKEEALEFPSSLAKSPQILERIAKRAAESETRQETPE